MGTKHNSRKNVAATAAASMKTGTGTPRVRKVMHAKAEKPAATATATSGKKIGKGTAKAKAGAAKPAKAKTKRAAGEGSRQSFAGKAIKVLTKAADTGFREGSGRAVRFAAVAAAKNTDDVLGKSFKAGNGKTGEITGAHLAFFVENGNIALT